MFVVVAVWIGAVFWVGFGPDLRGKSVPEPERSPKGMTKVMTRLTKVAKVMTRETKATAKRAQKNHTPAALMLKLVQSVLVEETKGTCKIKTSIIISYHITY